MDTILQTFHIDVKLLLAQIINFIVVFVILYYIAIKPLVKLMDERSKKIEQGLDNAEKYEKKLEELEEQRKKVLVEARKQAKQILDQSKQLAEENRKKSLEETKKKVQNIIIKAKQEVEDMKLEMVKQIQKESMVFIVDVCKKILQDISDKKVDKELVKKYFDKLK